MACRFIGLYSFRNPCHFSSLKVQRRPTQARSQSFRDEGNSSNTVDANMSILRYRMKQVRIRERLDTLYKIEHGWLYRCGNDDVRKNHNMLAMSIELITIVGSTIGLVFLIGSLCIFLVSLILSPSIN